MDIGDRREAEASFGRALRLEPEDSKIQNNYGWFLCQTGRERESVEYFQRAAANRLYPTPGLAMRNAGVCLMKINDLDGAERSLRRALEIDAADPMTKYELARLYLRRNQPDRAEFYFGLLDPASLAIAPIAAGLPAPSTRDCRESGQPVAVALFNGTEDPVNPFAGGLVSVFGNSSRGEVLSSEATARYWATLAGYEGEPQRSELPDRDPGDGTRVRLERWQAPRKPEIAHYVIEGGGHTVPSHGARMPRLLGRTSHDIDGAQEAWSFFQRQWAGGHSATNHPDRQERPTAATHKPDR